MTPRWAPPGSVWRNCMRLRSDERTPLKFWNAPESSCNFHETEQSDWAAYVPVTGLPSSRPVNMADETPLRLPFPSKTIRPRLAVGFSVPEILVVPDNRNPYGPINFAGSQTSARTALHNRKIIPD